MRSGGLLDRRERKCSWGYSRAVSATVLGGDSELARPVVNALRRERYGRTVPRTVAVSIYRLISRMEYGG